MKNSILAVLAASGIAFAASGANAQIVPQTPVTVNLVMDAFQSVPATSCTATVPGTVSGNRLSLATSGVTFGGAFPCPAVTMTSNIAIDYTPTSSSAANIAVTGISTTSVLGTCVQPASAPISGTASLSSGTATGVIPGTPSSCTFAVAYSVSPAFTSF